MRVIGVIVLLLCLSACNGSNDSANAPVAVTTPAPAAAAPAGPVVLMGDSITAYWNTRSTTLAHIADYVDAGVPGQTTAQMLARFDTDVLAHQPSVVVILGGTNDMYLQAEPNVDSIGTMADRAAQAGARVIIGMVPKGGDWQRMSYQGATGDAAIALWNRSLTALAHSHGYQIADYYDALLVGATGAQNLNDYTDDKLHPNSAGYDAMWGVLQPLLATDSVELR